MTILWGEKTILRTESIGNCSAFFPMYSMVSVPSAQAATVAKRRNRVDLSHFIYNSISYNLLARKNYAKCYLAKINKRGANRLKNNRIANCKSA